MARIGLVLVLVLGAVPATASAGVFKLFGQVDGGGMYGKGTSGDQKAASFFQTAPHATYGGQIGAEFLFLDGWIQHHQYISSGHLSTWTQFGVGVHTQVFLGAPDPKTHKTDTGGFVEFGAGLWFGIGTGQQVMPPLSNDEITDKAFLMEGRLGLGTHLSSVFDFGVAIPVSYGYFFKNGAGATANDLSTHYRSVQAEGLLFLRANINLF